MTQATDNRPNRLLRRARRFFTGPADGAFVEQTASRNSGVFTQQAERFAVAQTLVRAFYAFALYFLLAVQFPEFGRLIEHPPMEMLWPIAWLHWTPTPAGGVKALLVFYTLATLAALVLPGQRWTRILLWLGLLELVALKNSGGKIGHSLHLLVLVAFVLIFLPRGWHRPAALLSRRERQSALLVFWTVQAAVLLSYTMSGLGKLGGAVYQMARGQPNAFMPGGLGAHVAERLLQTHSNSLVGGWIIDHPWLTWPMMPGAIYVELFSFWIVFRPELARIWTLALIFFHVGVYFSMTINFPQNCLLLALFFLQSPFQPAATQWGEAITRLPLVGDAWKMQSVLRRRRDVKGTHRAAAKAANPNFQL